MRILMVGDVVGKPGRIAAIEHVPALRRELAIDAVVLNGENSAAGIGITAEIGAALLHQAGVDVITLGNHAWGKRDAYSYLDAEPRVLRPENYPAGAPGRGYAVYTCPAGAFAVVVLQGRTFMDPLDDPFRAADRVLDEVLRKTSVVLIDFHAEATSEKQAFGWYVDGRASAVIGTHTHVQTADERILPGGTAYLTDVGMTGPTDSVIGMDRRVIISRFMSLMPSRFEVAEGAAQLSAVVIEIDSATGRAIAISRVQRPAYPKEWPGEVRVK